MLLLGYCMSFLIFRHMILWSESNPSSIDVVLLMAIFLVVMKKSSFDVLFLEVCVGCLPSGMISKLYDASSSLIF